MIYIFGWGAVYYTLLFSAITSYRGRVLGYFAIFLLAGISILRGRTGTDTATYEFILSELSLNQIWGNIEPGFAVVALLLTELTGSAEIGVRAVSVLFFLLAVFYYHRANKNEAYIFLAYYAPAYFYLYSMNTIRTGIASIILLIAFQDLTRVRTFRAYIISILAVFFHYASIILIGYLIANLINKFRTLLVIFFGLFILSVLYFAQEYLLLKLIYYSNFDAPSSISGLSIIGVIFILTAGVMQSNLPFFLKARLVVMTIILLVLSIFITTFSYAGLRLLDLIAFGLPLSVLVMYSKVELTLNLQMKCSFLLAGLASAVGTYRNFLLDFGQGSSPFLPYTLLDKVNLF